jgi:hypothetical protein
VVRRVIYKRPEPLARWLEDLVRLPSGIASMPRPTHSGRQNPQSQHQGTGQRAGGAPARARMERSGVRSHGAAHSLGPEATKEQVTTSA